MLKVNTLFIMSASILVLLMTPGLAFFYGGLVNRRHANNMLLTVWLSRDSLDYSRLFSFIFWQPLGNSRKFK